MNKGRRIGALVAMSAAALGLASIGLGSPAVAAPKGPQPVSTWLTPVKAHTNTWVNISWKTNQKICDVEVRVDGRDVDVMYPGVRHYSSFSKGDTLKAGKRDYTAVKVNPDFDRSGVALLRATIYYDTCGWHARTQTQKFWLSLPVRHNNWPGHGFPGGPGNGGPGNGGPGNGGPGHGPGDGHGPWHPGDDNHQPGQQQPGQQQPGQQQMPQQH
jgi:hypothetical protein